MRRFEIFTDGSSITSHGIIVGGYAAHITNLDKNTTKIISGNAIGKCATIGRMELMAAVHGILNIPYQNRKAAIVVRPDSMYVVNSINTWIYSWSKNNWKKSTGDTIAHLDLMVQLHTLAKFHSISALHIKGHSGHPLNELCDKEAYRQASSVLDAEMLLLGLKNRST